MMRIACVLTAMLALIGLCGCPGSEEGGDTDVHVSTSSGHAAHGEESAEEHAAHGEHDEGGHAAHDEPAAGGHVAHDEGEPAAEGGGGHEGHDHAALITLSPEQIREYGVEVGTAAAGSLELVLSVPGEVAINEDAVGHVLPSVSGVVKSVHKNIGDSVRKGDLVAVIDSRELAEAKAAYLAAEEHLSVARTNEERERQLFERGVSPEQDYLNAQNIRRAAEIEVRAAQQALSALGVTEKQLAALDQSTGDSLTRYEIRAPLSGRILEKHVSVGEMVGADSELFLIADLSTVWVHLNVSQQDLARVREGQPVKVHFGTETAVTSAGGASGLPDASGTIDYIDALVAEDTRTARARVEIANPLGQWRPGMFVTGLISVDTSDAPVVVPLDSVISFEGLQTVFIADEHGFEPRTVTLGRQSATHVEVLSGLKSGERYVVKGAFMVKAELGKSEAGHGH